MLFKVQIDRNRSQYLTSSKLTVILHCDKCPRGPIGSTSRDTCEVDKVIRERNSLSENIRYLSTACLKQHLNKIKKKTSFSITGQTLGCSSLNQHLFNNHVSDSNICDCGMIKTDNHYLLECQRFLPARQNTISKLPTLFTLPILCLMED